MKNPEKSAFFKRCRDLIADNIPAVCVEIAAARGSSPRDHGACMLVTDDQVFDTIGGGQLEWIAIGDARDLLSQKRQHLEKTIKLGPEIGQCCGGSVDLIFTLIDKTAIEKIAATSPQPIHNAVQIHGAGHTGTALAKALELLPFETTVIDSRDGALQVLDTAVKKLHTPMPEQAVKSAPAGSAFVIFTHDHQLDFMIAAEALNRGDAAYVGMIGSKTKRAVFCNWLEENGYRRDLAEKLVCPIGGAQVKDKRPQIIAALVAAELIGIFAGLATEVSANQGEISRSKTDAT